MEHARTELGLRRIEAHMDREIRIQSVSRSSWLPAPKRTRGTVVYARALLASRPAAPTAPSNQVCARATSASGVRPACGAVLVRCRQLDALSPSQRVHEEIPQHRMPPPRDSAGDRRHAGGSGRRIPSRRDHQPLRRRAIRTASPASRARAARHRPPPRSGGGDFLHGEMDQPEPSAIASFRECRRERAKLRGYEGSTRAAASPGHVHRMVLRQKRPGHVRYAGPLRLGFPARARAASHPGGNRNVYDPGTSVTVARGHRDTFTMGACPGERRARWIKSCCSCRPVFAPISEALQCRHRELAALTGLHEQQLFDPSGHVSLQGMRPS